MKQTSGARHLIFICAPLIFLLFNLPLNAKQLNSDVVKFDDTLKNGKYPYNSRIIDNRLMAGGFLFNPQTLANNDEKVREYLKAIKQLGISSVILLHVPLQSEFTSRLQRLCESEGLELFKLRMNNLELPSAFQLAKAYSLIKNGAYVHCMWGCDRTGAIIAKYLRDFKGYDGCEAYKAVISGGSHSGRAGGFKESPKNHNLLLFFWPEAPVEAREIYKRFCPPR